MLHFVHLCVWGGLLLQLLNYSPVPFFSGKINIVLYISVDACETGQTDYKHLLYM